MRLCRYTLPSTIVGPVVVVAVSSIAVVTNVAKNCCKDHRDNQDGVGDGKYQYKDKTDDAELSGLLHFVALLLTEGLWEGRVCVCIVCLRLCMCSTHHYTQDRGWHKAEESWQPKQHCEDNCSHQTGHKGVLGEVGGMSCGHYRLLGLS